MENITMYRYVNEHMILPYSREAIKVFEGTKQIEYHANPTREILERFGYKILVEEEMPTYDEETQYLEMTYINEENRIVKHYEVKDIPEPEPEETAENQDI